MKCVSDLDCPENAQGRKQKSRGLQSLPKNSTYDEMPSPVGVLTLITSNKGLHAILWDTDRECLKYEAILNGLTRSTQEKNLIETKSQLLEYFQGERKVFNLPLVVEGTDFQIETWRQLQAIPYGATISYREQAERIGSKNKARAVGMANGVNPISIVIPCHRVIGSQGQLVGFGGGLERKAWLLEHEKRFARCP